MVRYAKKPGRLYSRAGFVVPSERDSPLDLNAPALPRNRGKVRGKRAYDYYDTTNDTTARAATPTR